MDAKASFEKVGGELRLIYSKGVSEASVQWLREHPPLVDGETAVAECVRTKETFTRWLDGADVDFAVGHFTPVYDRETGVLSGVRVEYERGA